MVSHGHRWSSRMRVSRDALARDRRWMCSLVIPWGRFRTVSFCARTNSSYRGDMNVVLEALRIRLKGRWQFNEQRAKAWLCDTERGESRAARGSKPNVTPTGAVHRFGQRSEDHLCTRLQRDAKLGGSIGPCGALRRHPHSAGSMSPTRVENDFRSSRRSRQDRHERPDRGCGSGSAP